jgi:hypothetical protein
MRLARASAMYFSVLIGEVPALMDLGQFAKFFCSDPGIVPSWRRRLWRGRTMVYGIFAISGLMIEKVMTRSIVGWLTVIISVHFESSVLKRTPPLSSQLPFRK